MNRIEKNLNTTLPLLLIFFLFLFIAFPPSHSAQCAMCKAAAESDMQNNPNSIAKGLNKGILFLMAIPYLILFVIFRKETINLITSIRGKSKEPLDKTRLQWLTFGLTFVSVMIVLFIIFYNVMYP